MARKIIRPFKDLTWDEMIKWPRVQFVQVCEMVFRTHLDDSEEPEEDTPSNLIKLINDFEIEGEEDEFIFNKPKI